MSGVLCLTLLSQVPQYQYWFDDMSHPEKCDAFSGNIATIELDAANLNDGIHTLHFQVKKADGTLSAPASAPFMKTLNTVGSTAYIYIDGEQYTNAPIADGVNADIDVDAAQLSQGLHTIGVQIATSSGMLSPMRETVFMRMSTADELSKMRCWYILDNDSTMRVEGKISGKSLLADIDVANLREGIHSISFMLASEDGLGTKMHTAWFFKLPLGGASIKNYRYWINDDMASAQNVNIANPTNPYTLTALLPLKSYPFRSSSFHFAVENDIPVVYPQNDFNIIFQDCRGYFALQSAPYYDVSGRKPIDKIIEWSGTRQNTGPIAKNSIVWYKFDAQSGDSIAVKVDKGAMFEVFTPDGTKLIARSGAKAVRGGGAHTTNTGTHYLAVHDLSDESKSVAVTLNKIDRYAILKYTPKEFAAKGGSIIFDLYGNGFNDIDQVELRIGDTKITPCSSHIHNWEFARFGFDLSKQEIPIGRHTLAIVFKDSKGDTETLERQFVVSNPVDGEIAVSVNPRNNTISDPRIISVTITNKSNYPAIGVPFCTARTSFNPIFAYDFNVMTAAKVEDSLYYDTDNLIGKGIDGRYTELIIPYIGPKESVTYDFRLKRIVGNNFKFYAWCGLPWSRELTGEKRTRSMARNAQENTFNYTGLSDFQNALNLIADIADNRWVDLLVGLTNTSLSAGCAIGGYNQALGQTIRRAEDEAYPGLAEMYGGEDPRPQYRIPAGMTPSAIAESAGFYLPSENPCNRTSERNCRNADPQPDCHYIQFPSSIDPNDILGYTSPSGSMYIGRNVKTLEYTVEFENDPELATTSALTIKIDNNLDGNVLDLTTFKPVSLRIGAKTVNFSGEKQSLIETVDMRPEINGIAQVTLDYDREKGSVELFIETLDPYTMEPTEDTSRGVLPVNQNGNGMGEFCYSVNLKPNLSDGTVIENRASIVFDSNEAIQTPAWRNETDYVLPVSTITQVKTDDNRVFALTFNGTDDKSGIWCYDVYMRTTEEAAWSLIASGIEEDNFVYTSENELEAVDFKTVAYDHAGNMESDETSDYMPGDLNGDLKVDSADLLLMASYYVGRKVSINLQAADLNGDNKIDSQDIICLCRLYLNSGASVKSIDETNKNK